MTKFIKKLNKNINVFPRYIFKNLFSGKKNSSGRVPCSFFQKRNVSTLVFILYLTFLFCASVIADSNESTSSILMEPVILKGADLPALVGSPIDKIRVYAKRNGSWRVIPFQIDEMSYKRGKKKLQYVFPPASDSNPYFDDDDELVFLFSDMGEQGVSGEPDLGQKKTVKVEMRNPSDDRKSYAYILLFDNPPPLSSVDYVSYESSTGKVSARGYTVGYPEYDDLFFNYLAVPQSRGGTGENFVDTFKVRANGRVIVQLFVYDVTNADYRNRAVGTIDGPVRVIRRVKVESNGIIFRVHKDFVNLYYYPDWFSMDVPLKMGVRGPTVTYQADASFSVDLNSSGKGMFFINGRNKKAVIADGELSDDEKNMDYGPSSWFALYGKAGAVMVRMDRHPSSGARQDLYYMDDDEREDAPESEKGMIGNAGFNVLNINRIPGWTRVMNFKFYFPLDFNPSITPQQIETSWSKPPQLIVSDKHIDIDLCPPPIVEQTRWKQPPPRPTYEPPPIAVRTRGYLPQLLIDPNLGYGSGFQIVERKTLGTDLSSDFLFLISHRAYQFYRLEEILKDTAGIDTWRLYIEYILHPNRFFFGIGNEQTPDGLTVFRQERWLAYLRMEKYLGKHFMVAFQPGVMYNDIGHGDLFTKDEPSIEEKYGPDTEIVGERFGPEVYGLEGGWTNSLRVDLALDYRDDKIYTRKGFFHILEAEYTPKWLGSDYEYTRYRLDLRFYFGGKSLNPETEVPRNLWLRLFAGSQTERVLAIRLVVQRMEAEKIKFAGRELLDIPFYNQSYFGDANSSRGHYWAQWIDNDLTFAMFELRWHMWKIIDATIFYDVGRVWEDIFDFEAWKFFSAEDLHHAYGFGMRFNMVPALMMRVDYGFSSENPGGLLYIYGWHTF